MSEAMDQARDALRNNPDIEAIKQDLASLKRDLAALLDHSRDAATIGTVNAAQNLAQQLSDQASDIYRQVADRSNRTAEALGQKVEEQPITSLLLAFSLGFIASRITR
jgi:ElaB/YqjD/DUF883 family membrane-anchored ribosome-binding protein